MSYAIITLPDNHPAREIAKQTCPTAYDSIRFDRKGRADGSALHHEYYDYSADAAIICLRETEGNKYGVKTISKTYYLLEEIMGVPIRTSLAGHNIALLAKKAEIGQVIARMRADIDVVRRALVGDVVIIRCDAIERTLIVPRGWKWNNDKNGLRVVKNSDSRIDYHPAAWELRDKTTAQMTADAMSRYNRRRAEEQKAREELQLDKLADNERTRIIAKAEREGATVCLVDALKAGNCLAGAISFVERHKLHAERHYKPSQLLKIANGSADRVRLAVYYALRRHRRELQQGFALLADHRREVHWLDYREG